MTWKWEEGVVPENFTGFVYIIRSMMNGKYYIGQKKFWFRRKLKPLKGKTRFRHKLVESDWKTYYGSCLELQKDVRTYGKENFTREIIHLCKSKSEMNYLETQEQFKHKVLHDPKSYNGIINCRISKNQINF